MTANPLLVHAALILVSVLFGVNYVCVKGILAEVHPRAWVYIRILAATTLLVPWALWRRRTAAAQQGKMPWGWLVLAAFFGVFLNQILFTEGLARTTAAHSAVINTSIPVLTLVFAATVRQEGMTKSKILALVVALAGVLTLLEADRLLRSEDVSAYWTGDLLTLGNAASFSVFVVLMRHISQRVRPSAATLICFLFGCMMMMPWSVGHLDQASLDATLLPGIWQQAAFVILGATVLTYLLNNWALKHAQSSLVVLYIYLQPIVATGLQMFRGKEAGGVRFWVALVLVFLGILLASADGWFRRPQKKP